MFLGFNEECGGIWVDMCVTAAAVPTHFPAAKQKKNLCCMLTDIATCKAIYHITKTRM